MSARVYFVSRWVDLLLLGGLSLVVLAALWWADHHGHRLADTSALRAFAVLAYIGNYPHFAATYQRLYRTRATAAQFPVTAWVLPPLLAATAAVGLCFPHDVAPFLLKLFILWSPYHFTAQTLGISLIYARRAGVDVSGWHRRALDGFVFAICVHTWIAGERGGPTDYYSVWLPQFSLPTFCLTLARLWLWVSGALLVAALLDVRRRQRRWVPWVVLFPVAVHLVWFVLRPRNAYTRDFINFFHSVQYLLIACAVQAAETRGGVKRVLRSMALNVGIGAAVFVGLPALLAPPSGLDSFFVVGVTFAVLQIHHFFIDAVIWKLKDPRLAAVLSGASPVTLAA